MPEEVFVAEVVVGSRAEGRARRAELTAQADRWFGANGSVWLGSEVTEARQGGSAAGFRIRARYAPRRVAVPAGSPGGVLQRAAAWLGLVPPRS